MTSASTLSAAAEDTLESLLEVRILAIPDRLKLVRGSIRAAARMCGFSDTTAQSIVLAVDEACQNIIRHAYGGDPNREIYLDIRLDEDHIVFDIVDFADPVDVEKIRPRNLDDVRPGGLGTHFIKECMDKTEYPPPPEGAGNLLRMVKKIS